MTKVIMATVAVVWFSLVGGNWLGHYIVSEGYLGKKENAVEFREMPAPRPRPWVSVDPKLQEELNSVRASAGEELETPETTVTSTPLPTNQAIEGGFGLQFGAFGQKSHAERLSKDLRAEGQEVTIEEVETGDSEIRFRVRGGSFTSASEAKTVADGLREKGFKVHVVSQ